MDADVARCDSATIATRPGQISARRRFADNLRQARKAKALSQEAVGGRADLHPTYVSSVERGERSISIDNMERLAQALGLDVVDLLRKPGDRQ